MIFSLLTTNIQIKTKKHVSHSKTAHK